jgi:acetyl esterase/lipase
MNERIDWHSLGRAELDAGYNNAAAVPGSAEIMAAFEERSAAMRAAHPEHLDLAYGPRPRNRIDLLSPGEGAPILVFIHGGYWQMRSKETFTFTASGPLAHGIGMALVGYTLAPDATLDDMAAEIRAAIDFLGAELPRRGGDPSKLWISGWSAGGHLAAMSLDHPLVRGGLVISGIYDLEPIRHIYVNDKLGLDESAAARNSPTLLRQSAKPLEIAVGGAELPLMRQQSADFARARSEQGLPGGFHELRGDNHFTIMEQLASPEGRLTGLVRDLCKLK